MPAGATPCRVAAVRTRAAPRRHRSCGGLRTRAPPPPRRRRCPLGRVPDQRPTRGGIPSRSVPTCIGRCVLRSCPFLAKKVNSANDDAKYDHHHRQHHIEAHYPCEIPKRHNSLSSFRMKQLLNIGTLHLILIALGTMKTGSRSRASSRLPRQINRKSSRSPTATMPMLSRALPGSRGRRASDTRPTMSAIHHHPNTGAVPSPVGCSVKRPSPPQPTKMCKAAAVAVTNSEIFPARERCPSEGRLLVTSLDNCLALGE